ncbi:conserved hypothetical protein [Leishmania major strain Friedlin]|uniref:Uncharacterized protein n=1 Tax=Leishmania major TaxID=5664 RepID=E9ADE4_LEIMA|nr:conserved hypothetical protein [Leishmania major strain Friedlin]CAG9576772.1 hypothetical_protein_-_conserved [Leishmania major strain Friedlin]CBZ12232.1 conserved hypothetical protein [Leishmania major strain Friedlin]|eukprot:XP_003721973.1 conserved hypothetical protein [Leishmania major strain Friedlin]
MSATDPYSLSPQNGVVEATLFQLLFPAHVSPATRAAVGNVIAVKTLNDNSPEGIAGALVVSSPSAFERIRAWETMPHGRAARSFRGTKRTQFDNRDDPALLHTVHAQQRHGVSAAKGPRARHSAPVGPDRSTDASADFSTVPFSLRLREVERRFREQMKVHRGLTAASRQVDIVERSVQLFQAERRTRAFAQALAERQDAIWARVWPGGSLPKTEDTEATAHRQAAASARVAPMPASRRSDSSATPSASTAISPPPPASPTGFLLKDILDTYSKPRELREASGGSRSAAAAAPAASKATKMPKGVPLAPAREAQRTVAGVEIFRPEKTPKHYTVIRYVEARSKHAAATHNAVDRQGTSPSSAVAPATAAAVSAASSKDAARGEVKEDSTQAFSSVVSEVHQADEEGGGKASDQSSASVADEAASMNDTYDTDTFDSHVSSGTAVDASISKAKSSVVSSMIPTVEATSSSLTQSITSEEVESGAAGRPLRCNRRDGGKRSGASVADDEGATPFAETLQAFLDACRSVSAASARLLQSPYIRESSHDAGQGRQHTPNPAKIDAPRSAPKAVGDAASCVTAKAATGADVSPAAWRDALLRQLRNIRRLQRFREHLLRHLKRIDLQRQTHCNATRLLRETQALAKVRRKLLSSSRVGGEASLGSMLRHVKGVSTGTGGRRGPRRGGGRHGYGAPRQQHSLPSWLRTSVVSDADTISDVVLTDMNSSVGEDIISADSGVVEEEMRHGSDQSETFVSDSIVQEEVVSWDGASRHSEVASGGTVLTEVSRSQGGDGDPSYGSDSFEAASNSDAAGRSAWTARSGMVAEVRLDEIEEELANRLAEISSDAISEGSSIPSEVEELVDLLPSSLIPSEVEDDDASPQGSSAATMGSYIATDMSSSAAGLQGQQRRMYVGAKGSTAWYAAAGEGAAGGVSGALTDHKAYIRDSPGSSVYSVPEDADVDTSMPQSTDVRSEGARDSVPRTSGRVADLDAAASLAAANEKRIRGRASPTPSTKSDGSSSSSEDALTMLEVDMTLTKGRRHHALRCASDVPTFEQLYSPSMPPLDEGPLTGSGNPSTTSSAGSGRSSKPDRRKGGSAHSVGIGWSNTAVSSLHERGAAYLVHYPTARMEAGTQAEMRAVGTHPTAICAASGMRATYPTDDYVAQGAWKARQLHLLRQLRSPIVDDSEDTAKNSAEATDNPSRAFEQRHRPPKDKADAVLDAAEAAAREEWAQHWGVVESLLQTRFSASSCIGRGEPPSSSRRTGKVLLQRFPSDSTSPTRDASQSSVPVSSASR